MLPLKLVPALSAAGPSLALPPARPRAQRLAAHTVAVRERAGVLMNPMLGAVTLAVLLPLDRRALGHLRGTEANVPFHSRSPWGRRTAGTSWQWQWEHDYNRI